ncbi:MAG: hypothetical protein KDB61_12245, partial [Planctomycetes bacterium]|nr:hypothetical protein [Planctomycetota bacterium]
TGTLWALPTWPRRVLVFLAMYLGGKAYSIADRLERMGGTLGALELPVRVQGTSLASAFLLCVFAWWYWRDYVRRGAPAVQAIAPPSPQ